MYFTVLLSKGVLPVCFAPRFLSNVIYSLRLPPRSGVSRYATVPKQADIGSLHFRGPDPLDAVRINALPQRQVRINDLADADWDRGLWRQAGCSGWADFAGRLLRESSVFITPPFDFLQPQGIFEYHWKTLEDFT